MQVEAERKKRAAILESEGIRESEINVAQGKKAAAILASEGQLLRETYSSLSLRYGPEQSRIQTQELCHLLAPPCMVPAHSAALIHSLAHFQAAGITGFSEP